MTSRVPYAHVYLSPHLDDAVFSCGGRMWRQAQKTRAVVAVTVFAAAPQAGASLSPYAQALHARWGQPAYGVQERQREDQTALALLGVEAVHWPFRDCIYRRTPEGDYAYTSEQALWGPIVPSDEELVETLASRIGELPLGPGGVLYAPLVAGGHVDHRIVRRAAEASGGSVIYYEDFPYAADRGALREALADGAWEAVLEPLSEDAVEAKIAASAQYRSQISSFWASCADMAGAVRAFAERTGNGTLAERYWRPTPVQPLPWRE